MIDSLEEYEDMKELLAKYKESIAKFSKDPKQKPRVDAMKSEVRNLEAELKAYDRTKTKN